RTGAAMYSRDGSAPRMALLLKICARSCECLPALDAIRALWIGDCDEADDATIAAVPVPGEECEGAALARHLVKFAADILDAKDAIREKLAVHRLPFREVILPVAAARPFLVFLGEMRMQRTVALRPDGGGERMIVGLGVVTDDLHLLLHEPVGGRWHEARRAAEIVLRVLVLMVPAGIDDHHIARPHHLARGLF